MPTATQILEGLAAIANEWQALAVIWHVYFAALLGILVWHRPKRRALGVLLAIPLLSVAALAALTSNPFNAIAFFVLAVALIAISFRLPGGVQLAPPWLILAGIGMFVFGWVYPHFLETNSALIYMYAAPTGLIPCPTLSMVIGFSLITRGLNSPAWSALVALAGILYGILGAIVLGVALDWMLVAGASLLLLASLGSVLPSKQTLERRLVSNGAKLAESSEKHR